MYQTITYDASGNPLSYYNGTRYTFTWPEGRRLTSAAVSGKTYTYAYDSDGLRLIKTVDGVKHEYFYASGKLLRETYGNVTLDFLYSNNGHPYALIYKNGTAAAQTYYYITNLQGDVLALINTSGSTVASYTYDPYGKVLTATGTLANINPLRYRGYYYDTETSLYYLQSRYYDPSICRFINADAFASTGQGVLGHNMFAYCLNNPVSRRDVWGDYSISMVCFDFAGDGGGTSTNNDSDNAGYIYGQENEPYGSMKIGLLGTVAEAGCGPVAVYNALRIMGRNDISFEDIISYYNDNGGFLACGLAGSLPRTAISYLEGLGYSVLDFDYFDLTYNFGDLSHTADACIIWYGFEDNTLPLGFGIHFVAYSMENGVGTYYNHVSNAQNARTIPGTISDFYDSSGAFFARIIYIYKQETGI